MSKTSGLPVSFQRRSKKYHPPPLPPLKTVAGMLKMSELVKPPAHGNDWPVK